MSWQTITKENELAISEIQLEQVLTLNRLDAEYFTPIYLEYNKLIEKKGYKEIHSFASTTDGIHASIDFDDESNINLLSAMSPKENYFDISRNKTISKSQHAKNPRTELRVNDVIVSTVGTIGNCAVVDASVLPANSDRHIGIIRIKSDYLPHFISTFLLSKYGRFQTLREATGNVQLNLFIEKINTLKIPITSDKLQKAISDAVIAGLSLRAKSQIEYSEAEQMLLKEINLEGYKGTEEAISVRNFSEVLADNRFDAEYWQPDYDVILETLSKYKKGVSTIGDEFKQLKGNFKAEKDKEYNYVEIGDVNVSTGEVEHNSINGSELPANAKIKFGKRQLITSKVRPNRGATAILDNHEGYIGSGAFTVLTEQDSINLETLMVYLKAKPIRELLLRYNTGTSYPVITDTDVLKLPLPLIDKTIQKKISELVSVSATERQRAKELLEKAKRAVEIFVEKDEKSASAYLNQ